MAEDGAPKAPLPKRHIKMGRPLRRAVDALEAAVDAEGARLVLVLLAIPTPDGQTELGSIRPARTDPALADAIVRALDAGGVVELVAVPRA